MPTYQYACSKCGAEFELFQSMKDSAIEVCPKDRCPQARWGKGKVKRMVGTGAGLIFKGSGFYITDYRSEGYKAAAKKDSQSTSPAAPSTSSSPSTPAKAESPKPASTPSTPKSTPSSGSKPSAT